MPLLLAALAAAAQPQPQPPAFARAWATFSKTPAQNRVKETVEVATLPGVRRGGVQWQLRRTVSVLRGAPVVSYTNTLACPGARDALGAMEAISASPDVPGFGAEPDSIILDGVSYVLEAPGRLDGGGNRFMISSNVETSLAAWVDRTLKVLEPCWTATPPPAS